MTVLTATCIATQQPQLLQALPGSVQAMIRHVSIIGSYACAMTLCDSVQAAGHDRDGDQNDLQ